MSNTDAPSADDSLDPDEELLFARLNAYNDALNRGDYQQQAQLKRDHPDLVELLKCLEGLDSLAPAADDSSQTLVYYEQQHRQAEPATDNPLSVSEPLRKIRTPSRTWPRWNGRCLQSLASGSRPGGSAENDPLQPSRFARRRAPVL